MSRTDTWMPLYIGDYLADTMHLTGAEHGAYLLLLMHYWRNGPLPDDDRALAAIARTDRKEWANEVGPAVRGFFSAQDGRLHQKRMDVERAKTGGLSEKRKAAADARWNAQKGAKSGGNVSKSDARADANACPDALQLDTHAGARPSASPSQLQDTLGTSVPNAAAVAAPSAAPPAGPAQSPPDARTALFREGLDRLCRLTGKPPGQARTLLGRLLRDGGDDAALVALALAEAESVRPAEPVAWLAATIQGRMGQRLPSRAAPPSKLSWMLESQRRDAPSFDIEGVADEEFRH